MTAIPLLHSAQHHQHAPKTEYYHGRVLDYPEVPARIDTIRDHLLETGLVSLLEPENPLPKEALLKVHDAGMIDFFENVAGYMERIFDTDATMYKSTPGQDYLYPNVFPIRPFMNRLLESQRGRHGYYFFDNEGPVGKHTWKAALHAATLAYEGANLLIEGKTKAAYALCRPPGHHAGWDFMGGYCYLNNAAVGAAQLRQLGKVAVLDIDYHHGNGTQSIFWDDPDVLFGSIHAHPGEEYPYYSGYADETGGDHAPNTNFNLPLPPGTTAAKYVATFDRLLDHVFDFNPAALVISIGYDTFEEDPLSTFKIARETYTSLGKTISYTGLPVLLVQEGGYQVKVLGELATYFLKGILQL